MLFPRRMTEGADGRLRPRIRFLVSFVVARLENLLTGADHNQHGRRMDRQHAMESMESNNQQDAALKNVARLSNVLAKQLTGIHRTLAYRIKAQACSSLIVQGRAAVNGVWPGGIVALDIESGENSPGGRIHIRRAHLSPAAKQIIDRESRSVPAVTRLGDQVRIHRRS